jgi:hypothetical protein
MGMDIKALTTLLYSRALARVLKYVFVFGATLPFTYTLVSHLIIRENEERLNDLAPLTR